jgi:hypothetical protein
MLCRLGTCTSNFSRVWGNTQNKKKQKKQKKGGREGTARLRWYNVHPKKETLFVRESLFNKNISHVPFRTGTFLEEFISFVFGTLPFFLRMRATNGFCHPCATLINGPWGNTQNKKKGGEGEENCVVKKIRLNFLRSIGRIFYFVDRAQCVYSMKVAPTCVNVRKCFKSFAHLYKINKQNTHTTYTKNKTKTNKTTQLNTTQTKQTKK